MDHAKTLVVNAKVLVVLPVLLVRVPVAQGWQPTSRRSPATTTRRKVRVISQNYHLDFFLNSSPAPANNKPMPAQKFFVFCSCQLDLF